MALVNFTPIQDGTTGVAAQVNNPLNTIYNEFNGNINDANIKTAANINGNKILDSSLAGTKMDANFQSGWSTGVLPAPNTVTNNGNRSYDLVFNGTDLTDTVSEGMRLRTTRTVSAPTQCADLEASSSQYFSDASAGLTGMTFTDDFAVSAWVKLESYGSVNPIAGRWNGTSGWMFYINEAGAIILNGSNGAAANYSRITSYQSVPLNKWVYIAAQLDMSAFTATTTTSYIMIDGVNVPAVVARGGTNPVALVQAGDLNIGAYNSGSQLFDGKLAQVAVFGTKVTQATMITYMSQGLLGSEANLVCAYSLSNDITDLSANNNDLTANGGALATDVDSPFGSYLGATLDYGIITKTAFSTDTTLTVQVPEGCTIPTSGGVSAVSYSTQAVPYLFPRDGGRWELESIIKTSIATASNTNWGAFSSNGWALNVPVGGWTLGFTALLNSSVTTRISWSISPTALSGALGTEDSRWTTAIRASAAASTDFPVSISNGISISSSQNWVMYTLGATTSGNVLGSLGLSVIKAIPAYL